MRTRDLTYRVQYSLQRSAIHSICEDLGLKPFYPDYHQKKGDANTVLLYLTEDYDFNADLDQQEKKLGYVPGEYKQAVCYLENTDPNNRLDMRFMNHGSLDLRTPDWKDKLRTYIQERRDLTLMMRK
jgi:hypothetical protein